MKYINTRRMPVRLLTSQGVKMLYGLQTIELDELVAVPDFVITEDDSKPVEEPVVEAVEEPVVTTEKPKRRRRRAKKTEE